MTCKFCRTLYETGSCKYEAFFVVSFHPDMYS